MTFSIHEGVKKKSIKKTEYNMLIFCGINNVLKRKYILDKGFVEAPNA